MEETFSDSGGGFSFHGIRRWELRPVTFLKGEIATRRGSKERQLRLTVTCSFVFRPRETPPEGAQTQTWGAASPRPVCGSEEPTQVSVLGPTPPRGASTLGVSRPAPPVAFFHALPTNTLPPPSDPPPNSGCRLGTRDPYMAKSTYLRQIRTRVSRQRRAPTRPEVESSRKLPRTGGRAARSRAGRPAPPVQRPPRSHRLRPRASRPPRAARTRPPSGNAGRSRAALDGWRQIRARRALSGTPCPGERRRPQAAMPPSPPLLRASSGRAARGGRETATRAGGGAGTRRGRGRRRGGETG